MGPSGAATTLRRAPRDEGHVCILRGDCVPVPAQRDGRIRVSEHLSDPGHAASSRESERGPRVPRAVELEGANARLLRPASKPEPAAFCIARIRGTADLGAKHPRGCLRPPMSEGLPAPCREQLEELFREALRHRRRPRLAALGCGGPFLRDRAAHLELPRFEVDGLPLKPEPLATSAASREEQHEEGCETRLVLPSESDELLDLPASPVLNLLGLRRCGDANPAHGLPDPTGWIPRDRLLAFEEAENSPKDRQVKR